MSLFAVFPWRSALALAIVVSGCALAAAQNTTVGPAGPALVPAGVTTAGIQPYEAPPLVTAGAPAAQSVYAPRPQQPAPPTAQPPAQLTPQNTSGANPLKTESLKNGIPVSTNWATGRAQLEGNFPVAPAGYVAEALTTEPTEQDSDRRLSASSAAMANRLQPTGRGSDTWVPALPNLPINSTVTTVAATSVVLGLFFLSIWVVKRGMPCANSALPDEVVSIVGRKQLSPKRYLQLLRVGHKLVLLSVTPDGTEALTEVSDPREVDRLLGLCMQSSSYSSTAEFEDVLAGLSRETAPGFLGGEAYAGAKGKSSARYLDQLRGLERD